MVQGAQFKLMRTESPVLVVCHDNECRSSSLTLWIECVCVAGLGMRVAGLWAHFPFIPAVCVRRRPDMPLIPHCTKVSPPALSPEQVMINRLSIIEVKDFLHYLLMVLG